MVGPYEVVERLGEGGMGEVYRARDRQLGRDVALKVSRVPRDTALAGRLARESRLLARLTHPNIAAIYGLADFEGALVLVLEFVPGPTLADRLQRGRLPLDEVLAVAEQLADALQAAHQQGIAHRDLKPDNIAFTKGRKVKVLDFGLGKAFSSSSAAPGGTDLNVIESAGHPLGTAAYMSPEQARGLPVDSRTDIWAFGCVLYEMLTGTRAFGGQMAADVLAKVLESQPDFAALPSSTPASLRRLLRRCLEKSVERRLSHAQDVRLELEDARVELGTPAPVQRNGARKGMSVGILLGCTVAAGVLGAVLAIRLATPPAPAPTRLSITLPATDELVTGFQPLLALSPDGRTVVYRARRNGVVQLFRRSLDSLETVPIPGSENATGPFFSPDGMWLGFDGDGVLKRVRLEGGTATTICPAPGGATAGWGPGDVIIFGTNTTRTLRQVAAGGGTPVDVTSLDRAGGDVQHAFPEVLPDGRTVLFTLVRRESQMVALQLDTGRLTLIGQGTQPHYLPTGHLVFARGSTVWIAAFDARRLELGAEQVPLVESAGGSDASSVHFSVSRTGVLAYAPPGQLSERRRLTWIDRNGRETPVALEPELFQRVSLSPDGARLALAITKNDNTDVWVAQLASGSMTQLTFEPWVDTAPIWSKDGRFVVFRSERGGGGLFRRSADAAAEVERLTPGGGAIHTPSSWDPAGRVLLFTEFRSFTNQAIARLEVDGTGGANVLLDGPFAQLRPQLSPDGRWLAYQSDESGRFEIYVRPYPDVRSARWQISEAGGTTPRWRGDSGELYFHDGQAMQAVTIDAAGTFAAGRPRHLFDVRPTSGRLGPDYDVTTDGRRFLFIRNADATGSRPELVVVQHWLDDLRARVLPAP